LECPPNTKVEPAKTCPELQISKRLPSKREIIEAIMAMKRGKAAGVDNIPAEILQVYPHPSAEMLYPLFLNIWKEVRFPKDWKEGIIVKIPIKGDCRNCNNLQGITVLVVIRKVFTLIILDRNIRHTGERNSEGTSRF
jgi:hypothetical protein